MRADMTSDQLCEKLNRRLRSQHLDEVLDRLGSRCEAVYRDGPDVSHPANYYAIGRHAVAYLRWDDFFIPVRRMSGIPEPAYHAFRRLGVGFGS